MADSGGHATRPTPDSNSAKPFSCVVCHKRKVKCDRREPCANCEKAHIDCIYRPPPPPRRRKRERGADASASQEREKSRPRMSDEIVSDNHTAHESSVKPQINGDDREKSGSGRLIMKEGNSVYLDKFVYPWKASEETRRLNFSTVLFGRVLAMRYELLSCR